MKAYASNTGTRRNLEALRAAGWNILLTPDNPTRREGFEHAVDNGAWKAFQQGQPFDEGAFIPLVERHGRSAEFVVAPDIVAGGMESLAFSLRWLPRLRHLHRVLLPVQDGMDVETVAAVLSDNPNLGIFLGGSTEWKLATMYQWGGVAARSSRYYHVGRVNTARRIRLCEEAGADSFDGTSATKFSCTIPLLESARQFRSLLTPSLTASAL